MPGSSRSAEAHHSRGSRGSQAGRLHYAPRVPRVVAEERPATPTTSLVPKRLDLICALPVAALAILSFGTQAVRLLPGRDFWWDEAGQFWMAQGQFHLSAAGTAHQPLSAGISFGRNGSNLDPIGFTILLRGWIETLGDSPTALRALPFLFFLLAYLAAAAFGGWLRLPWVVNLSVPFAALATELPVRFSVELRAFSLELLAVICTGALTVIAVSRRSVAWSGLLALAFPVFAMTTRYSFVVAIAGSLGVLLAMALVTGDRRSAHVVALPLAGAAMTAGALAWNIGIFGGGRQASPTYTNFLELAGNWDPGFVAATLQQNFASGAQLVTGAFLVAGLVFIVGSMKSRHVRLLADSSWFPLYLFVAFYELVAAGISILGLSPWNAAWRWSIGLSGLAVLSGLGLARLSADALVRSGFKGKKESTQRLITGGIVAACWAVAILAAARLPGLDHANLQPVDPALAQVQERAGGAAVEWLVAADQWPTFRLLVETAALGDRPRPAGYAVLGEGAPGGVPPVFYTSDASAAEGLPARAVCSDSTVTAVLVPFAIGDFPRTQQGILRLGADSGCAVTFLDLGSGGTAALLTP